MDEIKRICLWSGPRNVSTAIMYSFAQRADTHVVDEPLYGHYLRVSKAPHPGAEDVMAAMQCDGERVVQDVVLGLADKPVLFFKHMAHHLVDIDRKFLSQTTNVLLTRDPRDMLPSLAAVLEKPILRDTGYLVLVEILEQTLGSGGHPVVIEARELLRNPEVVLSQLCEEVGIDFDDVMLSWPAGSRPEDGNWARYWYANVHRSTGFAPYRPKTEPFPEELVPLLTECLPYYERLSQYAIRADGR